MASIVLKKVRLNTTVTRSHRNSLSPNNALDLGRLNLQLPSITSSEGEEDESNSNPPGTREIAESDELIGKINKRSTKADEKLSLKI